MNYLHSLPPPKLASLVTTAGNGLVYDFTDFGHRVVRKVPSRATNGVLSLAEVTAAPGGGVPLHVHSREEETFYVLEGRFAFHVGDNQIEAGPGDTVYAPRKVQHNWQCAGETPGKMVVLFSPGNFENFLAELTQLPPPSTPGSQDMMAGLCARYEVWFIAPGGNGGGSMNPGIEGSVPFTPLVVPSGAGHCFALGDHRSWGKLGTQQTGGAFLLAETESQTGGGVPLHIHSREEETFYVLSGRFALQLGDRYVEAEAGDTIFAPRGIQHDWRCISGTPGRFLHFITPSANFEAFTGEMAAAAHQKIPGGANTTSAADFDQITARYGIEMLPSIK